MKTIPYLILSALLLFSCERKVEEPLVTVQLNLPSRAARAMAAQATAAQATAARALSSITDPLHVSSAPGVLSSNSVSLIGDSSLNETKNLFNSLEPSLDSSSDADLNCYLLVVSGPESDADFSKNYCAKKSDPGANLKIDKQALRLPFGPYVGLVDAHNYGGTISMELKAGDARVFTLLGFNSKGACGDIFTALKDKSKLSKAYRIGTSTATNLEPGSTNTVYIDTLSQVNTEDYFSDCVIPDPQTLYPVYQDAVMRKESFPVGQFRSFLTPPTGLFYCEALDVQLLGKQRDGLSTVTVPGTVDQPTDFSIVENAVGPVYTYDNEQDCSHDTLNGFTSVSDSTATKTFQFLKNQTSQRRWFKQRRVGGQTNDLLLSLVNETGRVLYTQSFAQYNSTYLWLDSVVPAQPEPNVCYEVVNIIRDFNGYVVPNPSQFTITNDHTNSGTPSYSTMFKSYSDCDGNNRQNEPIDFDQNLTSLSTWVKFSAGQGSFHFRYNLSNNMLSTFPNVQLSSVTAPLSASANSVSTMRFVTKTSVPNVAERSYGVPNCSPVLVSFIRGNGNQFVSKNGGGGLSLGDLRFQVADTSAPATEGYKIYANEDCTGRLLPMGTRAQPDGDAIEAPQWNDSSYYKFYIKPNGDDSFGSRKLMFYYGGTLAGFLQFDLTDPNH